MTEGQVVEVAGGVYRVETAAGDVEATLRGKLKQGRQAAVVVVGDRVGVRRVPGGRCLIDSVRARATTLVRRTRGRRDFKVVAANLDRLFVVASVARPPPSTMVVDRMLVMGEAGGMRIVLVFTKVDLPAGRARGETMARAYRQAGYRSVRTSVVTGEGMDEFGRLASSGSSALAGPSGVGKSSLLNWLDPSLELRTAAVGRKSSRGRHTTVASRLVSLPSGGRLADTPGFSDVTGVDVAATDLAGCFPEFRPYLPHCRFRDCLHLEEPDCAVLHAVDSGEICAARHRSYRTILEDL